MASSLLRLEEKQFSKTLVVSRPGLQPPCVSKGDEGWMPLTAEPDFPNLSVTVGHALSEVFSLSPPYLSHSLPSISNGGYLLQMTTWSLGVEVQRPITGCDCQGGTSPEDDSLGLVECVWGK